MPAAMSLLRINRHPNRKDLRVFASLTLLFGATFAWLALDKGQPALATIVALISLAIGLLGWLVPPAVRVIYLAAVYVTFPVGFVLSHVILAVVYYLVFTPVGLLMRLAGRDPLKRRFEVRQSSYWEPKTEPRPPASYLRQH